MRVGILSQWFPPETGGASIPGVLARGLVERGHEVSVLTGYPNYPTGVLYDGYQMKARSDSHEDGYSLRRMALYPDHSNRTYGRLLNYGSFAANASTLGTGAFRGIDVLWVYNSPATVAIPMWLTKARWHAPIVLHNMDMWPDSVIHTGFTPRRGGKAILRGLNAWVNAMYRSSTLVAYLTPSAGNELEQRGVPRTKLRYAPVWVDETVFRPADGSLLRRHLGYSDADIVVGYAGALGRAQCVLDLVKAIISLPEPTPIKCLILGSGTEADAISRITHNHPSRVQFLGQVSHDKMTDYAAVPDISFVGLSPGGQAAFAAPSKVPAIMACGKPLIAAASGDTAGLVTSAQAGIAVPPGDQKALTRALAQVTSLGRSGLLEIGHRALDYSRRELSTQAGLNRMVSILVEASRVTAR